MKLLQGILVGLMAMGIANPRCCCAASTAAGEVLDAGNCCGRGGSSDSPVQVPAPGPCACECNGDAVDLSESTLVPSATPAFPMPSMVVEPSTGLFPRSCDEEPVKVASDLGPPGQRLALFQRFLI